MPTWAVFGLFRFESATLDVFLCFVCLALLGRIRSFFANHLPNIFGTRLVCFCLPLIAWLEHQSCSSREWLMFESGKSWIFCNSKFFKDSMLAVQKQPLKDQHLWSLSRTNTKPIRLFFKSRTCEVAISPHIVPKRTALIVRKASQGCSDKKTTTMI